MRIILSIDLTHKRCHRQVDINNVFLHGDLTEEVYMVQPPSFEEIASDGSTLGVQTSEGSLLFKTSTTNMV